MPKLILSAILGAAGLAASGSLALPQDHRQASSGRVTVQVTSVKPIYQSPDPAFPAFQVKYTVTNSSSEEILFLDHLMHLNVEVKTAQGRILEPTIQVRLAEPDADSFRFVKPSKTHSATFTSLPFDVPPGMKSVTVSLVFTPPSDPKTLPKPKEPHGKFTIFPAKKLTVAPVTVSL